MKKLVFGLIGFFCFFNFVGVVFGQEVFEDSAMMRSSIVLKSEINKAYSASGEINIDLYNPSLNLVEVVVLSRKKEEKIEVTESYADGVTSLKIKGEKTIKPGEYVLKISDQTGETIEQNFLWGVLAININKAVYYPNETVKLAMVVLDDKGAMVCDAGLKLKITDPKGIIKEITTEGGGIIVNPECTTKELTIIPDYEAEYQTGELGNYRMELTASTKNGTYSIADGFETRKKIDYEIERMSATRIFPGNKYPMTLNIKANKDFVGNIYEELPSNFDVLPLNGVKRYDEVAWVGEAKRIRWEVSLKAGEKITLGYRYQAPLVSPEFYLIGPIKLVTETDLVYEEERLWQIAADAITKAKVRQEINIINTEIGSTAESGSIIYIDPDNYGVGASFYFEVVYDETDVGNSYTVVLEKISDDSDVATVTTPLATAVSNYRSRVDISSVVAGEYNVEASSSSLALTAARVIVLQSGDEITVTETQIEIGNQQTGITGATTMPLTSPKYWKYDSSVWDAGTTFLAEVSYGKRTNVTVGEGLTSFTADGTFNFIVPSHFDGQAVKIEAWGAGGGGGSQTSSGQAGGGGGGAYANETYYPVSAGDTLVARVGNGAAATHGGSSSVYEAGIGTSIVLAAGGLGVTTANTATGASGAAAASCIGDTKYAGGNGANAVSNGGGGGGGAGDAGTGGNANLGTGGTGGIGIGTSGGRGGDGAGTVGNGDAGSTPAGAGGGAKKGSSGTNRTGGAGADGRVIIRSAVEITFPIDFYLQEDDGSFANWTNKVTVGTGLTGVNQVRVRSAAFSPTTGRHYRLVGKVSNSGYYAVYSAKIIAKQSNSSGIRKLEPQYLLLNTKSVSTGTTLGFNTLWDADEWGRGSYVYRHAMDSIGAAANAKLVGVTAVTDITNSSITGANHTIGNGMTMPAADTDIDTWLVNAGTEVDASRILVQMTIDEYQPIEENYFRWRDDNYGINIDNGWLAAINTGYSSFTQGSTIRLRMEAANIGNTTVAIPYRIEYGAKSGSCGLGETYAAVPVSTGTAPFEMGLSGQYADGDNITTSLLTASGTFTNGEAVEDSSNESAPISIGNGYYSEVEYAIMATDYAAIDQSYCFRLTNAGSTTGILYTKYADAMVISAAVPGPGINQLMRHGGWFLNGVRKPFSF